MAKKRKSVVSSMLSRFPSPEETAKTVSEITKQGKETSLGDKNNISKEVPSKSKKPPQIKKKEHLKKKEVKDMKLTKQGRKKFTTMLRPDLKKKLSVSALESDISVADVLEHIIEIYYT